MATSRSALAALALALCLAGATAAARPQDAALDATARQRTYLERRPFHERVFEDLLERAVDAGSLDPLVAHYEHLHAADPDAVAPRVLLARLVARRGEHARAVALLAPLDGARFELARLRAALAERAGDAVQAAAELERALDLAPDDAARAEVLRARAELLRFAADDAGAREALLALAQLAGDDVALLLDAGERMTAAGLFDDAAATLSWAAELAGDDAHRRCTVLAALSEALVRARRGAEALAASERATALLAHGHWLRAELCDRALALRATAGTLEPRIDELRAQAEAEPEAGTWHDLARALEVAGRDDQALDALLAARALSASRAASEALDARVLELARKVERDELVAAELQRAAAGGSASVEAELALATALRAAGAGEAADRALARAGERAREAREWIALARHWRALGRLERARDALARAAGAAPGDVAPWLERAEVEQEAGDWFAVADALESAEARASGEARLVVAEAWRAAGDPLRARSLLERAASEPRERAEALRRAARLAEETGDAAAARETWRALAAASRGEARLAAIEALVASLERAQLGPAIERERELAAQDGTDPLPRLAIAALLARDFQLDAAAGAYAAAIVLEPEDLALRRARIDVLTRGRRYDDAAEELARLAERAPAERLALLLERTRQLVRARRLGEALVELGELRREAWRDPATLRGIAGRYEELGRDALAAEALEHALRLAPDHAPTARHLARLLAAAGRADEARRRFDDAWREASDDEERARVATELYDALDDAARAAEVAALVARVRDDPYDAEAPPLALALLARAGRYEELETVSDVLITRRPADAALRVARARARLGAGRRDAALEELRALIADGADPDALMLELLPELRRTQDGAAAAQLGRLAVDPRAAASALRGAGHERVAADLLTGFAQKNGFEDERVLDLLVALQAELRDPAFTLRVLTAVEARDGATVVLAHRIGELHRRRGQLQQARDYGEKLRQLGAPEGMVERYFDRLDAMRSPEDRER